MQLIVISLQPADTSQYGDDLRSGQIHFVDTRGNRKLFNAEGINVGSEQTCPDIRYGLKDNKKIAYYCLNTDEDQGFDRDFHVYELEWTPSKINYSYSLENFQKSHFHSNDALSCTKVMSDKR